MAIDFSSIQTITDEELLKAVRFAIASIMLGGQSYTINGRTFTKGDIGKLNELEARLSARVAAAAGTGTSGGFAYIRFN